MIRGKYLLPNGRVLRYSFYERLIHWMAGISYLYLLLSGLAFWSPWLFWIAIVLGGGTVARELHPWFGLVFFVAVLLMYRMWGKQMKETPADKGWWAAIGTTFAMKTTRCLLQTGSIPARSCCSGVFSSAEQCCY